MLCPVYTKGCCPRLCAVRVRDCQPGRYSGGQDQRGRDQGGPGVRLQYHASHRKLYSLAAPVLT